MDDHDLTTAYMTGFHKRDDEVATLKAEIERLRELAERREKQLDTHIAALLNDEAEIERLRGLLGDVQIILDSHNNIVGNLNGEIIRLRGLLREGLDHHDEYNWQQRVREALGDSNE